jgi:hypothetical protein
MLQVWQLVACGWTCGDRSFVGIPRREKIPKITTKIHHNFRCLTGGFEQKKKFFRFFTACLDWHISIIQKKINNVKLLKCLALEVD